MDRKYFDVPVCVRTEATLVRDIASVREASECLRAWPSGRRGPVFQTAMRACEAALNDDVTVDCARSAFVGFARIAGILVKDRLIADRVVAEATTGAPLH